MKHTSVIRILFFVAVTFISASCLSQQAQEANQSYAPVHFIGVAASQGALPAEAEIASISLTPTESTPAGWVPETPRSKDVSAMAPVDESADSSRISGLAALSYSEKNAASNSSESAAGDSGPELRGTLSLERQPTNVEIQQHFFGQRNDVGIFPFANFNPVTDITIRNTPHLAISSNKSSLGGSAEYRRWFSGRSALGVLYTQNPSDGKLLWQGQNYIWPQMRWDVSILATRSFNARNFSPFVSAGPGVVLTNGYGNCGVSGGFAFVAGVGTDYPISRRISARTGINFLETRSGCYDDHTCRETWGVVKDVRVGLVYKWGGQQSYLAR